MRHHASDWQRSSYCAGGGNNCVEVAAVVDGVAVRDSKMPEQTFVVGSVAFSALIAGVRSGHCPQEDHNI
jgi:hypothetical protein